MNRQLTEEEIEMSGKYLKEFFVLICNQIPIISINLSYNMDSYIQHLYY